MMKRKKQLLRRIAALSLAALLLPGSLAGCGTGREAAIRSPEPASAAPEVPVEDRNEGRREEDHPPEPEERDAFPGSYTAPEGWVEMEQYSSEEKIFYAEAGHENDASPDNISIEVRSNRYSLDEHETFRDAIVRQLTMQLQGIQADVTGSGSYTKQDYILYTFTISEEDVVTTQYYIVDDQRYCLIHLTNFTGSEGADEAALAIVDSFVWK